MKKLFFLMYCIILTTINACECESVTGEIIEDYREGKVAYVSLDNKPGAVNIVEQSTNRFAVNIQVGGKDIVDYRYRVSKNDLGGPWSEIYEKAITLHE